MTTHLSRRTHLGSGNTGSRIPRDPARWMFHRPGSGVGTLDTRSGREAIVLQRQHMIDKETSLKQSGYTDSQHRSAGPPVHGRLHFIYSTRSGPQIWDHFSLSEVDMTP